MHAARIRRALGIAALLALSLAPAAARATDWKDQLELLLAPGYQLVPGDYAASVPDTLLYVADQTRNVYTDFPARNADGTLNAVIEIPQGDVRKFETDVTTGRLFWELKGGKPRKVAYLGYPGNYGMVPRTLGGDGDPLDVIVIGATELRGAIAPARLVTRFPSTAPQPSPHSRPTRRSTRSSFSTNTTPVITVTHEPKPDR